MSRLRQLFRKDSSAFVRSTARSVSPDPEPCCGGVGWHTTDCTRGGHR